MGLATMVLVDTLARLPDAEALYSDGGVLSRADVAQLYGFLHADGVSVWMAGGSTAFAWCLFGVQLACVGAPKSHFFAKNQHQISKKSLQEGFQRNDGKSMKK